MRRFDFRSPPLQNNRWPVVPQFETISPELESFLDLSLERQRHELSRLRTTREEHAEFVNRALGLIYAYRFGYADSPCFLGTNDDREIRLEQAKILVERDLLAFLGPPEAPRVGSQQELVALLRTLLAENPGVDHPLFRYLEVEASRDNFHEFLLNDVIRNEIVDDEVAWLVAGHQGLMKEAAAINLYDECGRGQQRHFHTYWLRILLESLGNWDDLMQYRVGPRPWFAAITSNVFAMLLTRSAYKWAAYGHFIVTESWVPPHFERILKGMERVGLNDGENDIYFTAHVTLDPTHTEELILGLEHQVPALTPRECSQILWGGRLAIAGAVAQYDRMMDHLRIRELHLVG